MDILEAELMNDDSASEFLAHYGVMGQKKGVRRWQNKDMSLTPEGRIHYGVGEPRKKLKTTNQLYDDYPNHSKDKSKFPWDPEDITTDDELDKNIESYARLQKDIIDKSADWYSGKPKSEAAKKLYEDIEKGKIPYAEYDEKILGIVLEDLGYENTKAGRDYIYDVVFWD